MCGIVGIVNLSPRSDTHSLIQRMSTSLVHRGPDDEGLYLNRGCCNTLQSARDPTSGPQVGLAMRRLAIIDLQSGHQPIANEDETCWIVFNGEIYNHRELRHELEAKGHQFRTGSDTEAILHAYEEFGVDCVSRLRGMFAVAIWDSRQERLFLARDPVGIKPLYWVEAAGRLLFGSEIKALLQDPAVPRRVNRAGLHDYLRYLYVPAPQTMFDGIYQLPPGHRLLWQRGTVTVEEYWSGPAALLEGGAGPPVTASEVWSVLRESVGAHMLSDVPLGAFLSGGLDSTAIVALMAELSNQPVRTFSIGFRASGLYDELKYARQVAQHFRTDHNEYVLDPDAIGLLPEIIRHLDEPLADASVIPNYLVANLARRSVTVALTGTGGDELFGGYRRYYGDQMARRWQRVPGLLRRHVLLPALRLFPSSGDTAVGDAVRLAQKFLEPLDLDPERRYIAWNAFFSEESRGHLYADGFREDERADSNAGMLAHFDRVGHRPFADRAMYLDLRSYLPGDPLFLSDRMTMANSLEARVPFVDPKVMEFAARIPLSQKIRGRSTKLILRQMLAGRVPETIIHRPKRGFGTPIDLWLRRELSGLLDRMLSPAVLRERGYFRPEYVTWLREQQASGRRDFSQHLWALLVFELWHRAYIDADLSNRKRLSFDDLGLAPPTSRATDRRPVIHMDTQDEPRLTSCPEARPRLAVFKAGGIGDTLSAIPALRALRATYPDAEIALLTSSLGSGLLWNDEDAPAPLLDELVTFDCLFNAGPHALFQSRFWLELYAFRKWARRFRPDIFVCLHDLFEWRNMCRPALVAALTGSRRRLGRTGNRCAGFLTEFVKESRWTKRSVYERNLDVVRLLSHQAIGQPPRLSPRAAARQWASHLERTLAPRGVPIATLHTLGTRASRRWPETSFAELGAWLQLQGFLVCLLGAVPELALLEQAADRIPGAVVVTPPTLEATAAWLAQSALVVGNDSGIVHMAVATGTPTVALFGPGEHQLWGYWGLPYYEMVRLELPCWPCYRATCGETACLARLPVAAVAAAITRVLSDSGGDPCPRSPESEGSFIGAD
jgi:asparagine synthase (glutamine-hydrolysing)